jgi:hypothetical protein
VDHRQVGLVVGILEVLEERDHLHRPQHPLPDDHLGRQRADIKHQPLLEAALGADPAAGPLADDEQLPLESILVEAVGRGDEDLIEVGHRPPRGGAHVGGVGIDREFTPADDLLALARDAFIDDPAAFGPFGRVGRHEQHAGCIKTAGREGSPEVTAGDLLEEFVGEGGEHAGPVAGVVFAAAATAMLHVLQHPVGIVDDLPRPLPLDVGDEADPAGIVLEGRVIEAPGGRQAERGGRGGAGVAHGSLSFVKPETVCGVLWCVGRGWGAAASKQPAEAFLTRWQPLWLVRPKHQHRGRARGGDRQTVGPSGRAACLAHG